MPQTTTAHYVFEAEGIGNLFWTKISLFSVAYSCIFKLKRRNCFDKAILWKWC